MRHAALALALALAACDGSPAAGPPAAVDPALRAQVERSTGWTFKSDPVFETIDRAELLRKLEAKLQGEAGRRTAAAGRALRALGVLPKGYDLLAGLKKTYGEEILALYDLQDRRIYLVREALEKPPAPEDLQLRKAGKPTMRDVTIAHEMVHALQHQHDPRLDLLEDTHPDFDDLRVALHALAEGEATLHMYALLGPASADLIARSIEEQGAGKFPGEPALLRRLLFFPYAAGTRFAGARAGNGPALHAAPPLSTEEVLHPERTAAKDPPLSVRVADLSEQVGGGRTLSYEAVLGEAFLSLIVPDGSPGLASGFDGTTLSWGGDRLHLYEREGAEPVVVVVTRWDSPSAAAEARLRLGRKEGWAAVHDGTGVAFVVGLPPDAGRSVARVALERAVVTPFSSIDELRALRR